MNSKLRSVLIGSGVAATLIFPCLADPAPVAPPAAPAPAAMPAPHPIIIAMNNGGWVKWPAKRYQTHAVRLDDIVGTIAIAVAASGPMILEVSGDKNRVNSLDVDADGDTLRIEGSDAHDVWDWRNWFNFNFHENDRTQNLNIKLTVPKGAEVQVHDLVGNANIGDTYGPLKFEAAATEAKIGKIGKADISLSGAGKVDVAQIDGPLSLDIAGSGRLNIGPVNGKLSADVAGAGDASVGAVAGGLSVDIAGSGDLAVASVAGRTAIDIAGSGSVKIADGEANPLHVDIMGSGNLDFGGMAVDPTISALGSGNVRLKAYRGKLSSTGMASIKVGDKTVTVNSDDDDDN
jgi:Putative auto-transporter adhesin, head GIN domain